MKVLVTGASGLIGSNLVRELLQFGYQVRAFVRPTSDRSGLAGLDVEYAEGDVREPASLSAAAEGCEVLFHTAAIFSYWGVTGQELESTAVDGTIHALTAAARAGVRRVVLTSSSVVLGSSTRAISRDEREASADEGAPSYFTSKVAQERAALELGGKLGLEVIAVCPTITVGPRDYKLVPSNAMVLHYLLDPFKMTWPGGCNVVDVRDVACGHRLAAERGTPGERYLLGAENLEWSLFHRWISELAGVPGPRVHVGCTQSYLTGAALELWAAFTRRPPSSTREQAKTVGRFYWYRHDKAARELGYAPRPGRQALAAAVAWLLASPHLPLEVRRRLRPAPETFAARRTFT